MLRKNRSQDHTILGLLASLLGLKRPAPQVVYVIPRRRRWDAAMRRRLQ